MQGQRDQRRIGIAFGRRPCLVVTLALASSLAHAEGSSAPRRVTLAQARDAASRALRVEPARVRQAAAALDLAAAGPWPATTLGVSTTRRTAKLGVLLSVPVPFPGTREAERAPARAELDVARATTGQAVLDVRRAVAAAWIELARSEAQAMLRDAAATRETALAAMTRKRFDAGDASRADQLAADARAREATAQRDAARELVRIAAGELAAALGDDPNEDLVADGGLPPLIAVPALERLRARAPAHPGARAGTARVEAQRARARLAHRAWLPVLSVDLEAMLDDPTLPGNDYRIGLALQIPILGRTGDAARAADARAVAEVRDAALAMRDIDAAIVGAYRRYEVQRKLALSLRDDVVPAQREATALSTKAYGEGEVGLVTVIDANRQLADAEARAIDAHAGAAVAYEELLWAAGGAP